MNELIGDRPEVPTAIYALASEDPDLTYHMRCDELWTEIASELLDSDYMHRSHNVGTYDAGCRGPLCRKALREHPKRRAPHGLQLHMREERIFDPVLEYFCTVMKYRIRLAQQELLKELA